MRKRGLSDVESDSVVAPSGGDLGGDSSFALGGLKALGLENAPSVAFLQPQETMSLT